MRPALASQVFVAPILFALVVLTVPSRGLEQQPAPARIEVRISLERTNLGVGEPLEIEVELANRGGRSVYVGRRLLGVRFQKDPYNFEIVIKDRERRELPRMVVIPECMPFKKENFTQDDFQKKVFGDWIALHPGEAFKTRVKFQPEFEGAPLKAGRYLIMGRYSASGMEYETGCNWLAFMKDELKELPYKSFTGTVDSNEIWITFHPK